MTTVNFTSGFFSLNPTSAFSPSIGQGVSPYAMGTSMGFVVNAPKMVRPAFSAGFRGNSLFPSPTSGTSMGFVRQIGRGFQGHGSDQRVLTMAASGTQLRMSTGTAGSRPSVIPTGTERPEQLCQALEAFALDPRRKDGDRQALVPLAHVLKDRLYFNGLHVNPGLRMEVLKQQIRYWFFRALIVPGHTDAELKQGADCRDLLRTVRAFLPLCRQHLLLRHFIVVMGCPGFEQEDKRVFQLARLVLQEAELPLEREEVPSAEYTDLFRHDFLLQCLTAEDAIVRAAAANQLGAFHYKGTMGFIQPVLDALFKRLADQDPMVVEAAGCALFALIQEGNINNSFRGTYWGGIFW